ncbi:hypothetical protein [Halovivax limisalsi]|uniref:hypothetical protein n=1 Tax=Halovivax limisalsi TaxID=1453760 RepID=UPI001FFD5AB8|nr:hypothetical protein [Halovivax limisalsi]
MQGDSPRPDRRTRRRVLAAGAGAVCGGLAGCTRASEWLVDRVVGDVNVFNTTGARVTGALTLVDPAGETVLDESLALPADDGGESDPAAIYEETLTDPGSYDLAVSFGSADGTESGSVETAIEVRDPATEHVVVFLGERFTDTPVTVRVVEDFAELESTIEG